ncbi:methyl-accepting chemotaxis protein [Undibacterium terreum]|uniref:Methyl-accepting chemotaxis protein n=1 Tax=Undibacterium terreum TaxID=1224302 RepID=A0A916UEJ5_9BURK|nr:methyl-accepting chemotaxis protein [Undibacterium terreum]GGC69428.1 methyl-accepting chemotaxis protein [Undibacterium terreum]
MRISDWKIGTRLGLGFTAVLALMALMIVVSIWRLQAVGTATDNMVKADLVKERLASEWLKSIETNGVRTLAVVKSAEVEDQEYFQKQIDGQKERVTEIQKQLTEMIKSDEGKRLFADVGEQRKIYSAIRDNIFKMKKAGDEAAVKSETAAKMVPAMNAYAESVSKLVDYQKQLINNTANGINENYSSGRILIIALGLAAIAVGAIFSWRLAAGITKPLGRAVNAAEAVASGDLTTVLKVRSQDETGQLLLALKTMNDSLLKIVTEVRTGTDAIANASAEISTGNLDLSARTEQQAGSLEETASAMEELTSTVKQNADNARQANQLAVSASSIAVDGGNIVNEVVTTMGSINASSKKIVDIISVIDGIAFQTNILALNAAVEAARAGEQGRGFAVVATEVRNLAQRSAGAAKEIKHLIDDSVHQVDAGTKLVEQAGVTMAEVVASVKRVTDIVAEISAASQEQSTGIEEVNRAIVQMDEATQQNAALVEQAAAAAQSMQDQAANLAQVVSVFKLDLAQTQAKTPARAVRPVAVASQARAATPAKPKAIAATRAAASKQSNADWEEF